MKIFQIVTGLRKAAGTTTFVENVARELSARGHDVEIVTNETNLTELSVRIGAADVVHIHGLWSPLLHRASVIANRLAVPVVWSTHGMTAPWAMRHKWWKKSLAWHLYQKRDLKSAAVIHCTTELEVEWNRKLGFANCEVAPLGTTLPKCGKPESRQTDGLTVLFVGRIYPVKGLENLVRAAALLPQEAVRFRIVGPDQAGHQAELVRLAESLGVSGMFEWAGPRYDDELGREYANCDLLVLPSFTENFGAVVIDALAHAKPVIASKFTPWKVLEDEHCGWWVDNSPESLAAAFKNVMSLPVCEFAAMGARGRSLVEARYTWSAVCEKLVRGYEGEVRA